MNKICTHFTVLSSLLRRGLLIFTRTMHILYKYGYPQHPPTYNGDAEKWVTKTIPPRRILGVTFERRDTFPAALFISPKTSLLQMVGREEGREP